jgi:hypothetical protein
VGRRGRGGNEVDNIILTPTMAVHMYLVFDWSDITLLSPVNSIR